jgi:hypothetical protein
MKRDKETIVKAAHNMIERFGEGALNEVDSRIEELNRQKYSQATKLWVKIRSEIVRHNQSVKENTRH